MQDCARSGAQLWWPSWYALAFLITLPIILTPRTAMRWMLGTMEAGLFPGVTYYLSWYTSHCHFDSFTDTQPIWCSLLLFPQLVQALRVRPSCCHLLFRCFRIRGVWRSSRSTWSHLLRNKHFMTYCFSRTCQAAIANMDGVGGKPGWAWIFILEGLATVLAGAASFFIIQDFPDTARFLSEAERAMVIRRLQNDDQFSAGGETFKLRNIVSSLKDWKTWLGSELSLSVTLSNARLP